MSVISRSPFISFIFIAAHSLRMDGLIENKKEMTGIAARTAAFNQQSINQIKIILICLLISWLICRPRGPANANQTQLIHQRRLELWGQPLIGMSWVDGCWPGLPSLLFSSSSTINPSINSIQIKKVWFDWWLNGIDLCWLKRRKERAAPFRRQKKSNKWN